MVVDPDVPENTTEPIVDDPAGAQPPVDEPAGAEAAAPAALSEPERQGRLDALNELIEMIRPAVQADGGDLALVNADVEAGVVDVELQGSCSSCAISSTTLQAGVSRILRDRLEWVTEVRGGVDETMDFEESAAMGTGGYVPRF